MESFETGEYNIFKIEISEMFEHRCAPYEFCYFLSVKIFDGYQSRQGDANRLFVMWIII